MHLQLQSLHGSERLDKHVFKLLESVSVHCEYNCFFLFIFLENLWFLVLKNSCWASIWPAFSKKVSLSNALISGFWGVLENLESPGILFCNFPGLSSPGNLLKTREIKFSEFLRYEKCKWTVRKIDFEFLGKKVFKVKFGVLDKINLNPGKVLESVSEKEYKPWYMSVF